MINSITEWQSTSLNNSQHYMYFALVIVVVFVMLFSKKKILFIDFILLGISVFLGLKSISPSTNLAIVLRRKLLLRKPFISSPTICSLSAALPPLPQTNTFPSLLYVSRSIFTFIDL